MMESPPIAPGPDGCYHPSTVEQVAAMNKYATTHGNQLRVWGSRHSVPAAIGTSATDGFNVILDQMTAVSVSGGSVTVQAGCHLGEDPRDPQSTVQNSLLGQLAAQGLGLADTGGITHQTVAGFLATGSAGGSLTHALESQITGITLVDALGQVHALTADAGTPNPANQFYAAGVSLGLLGVITDVTFSAEPAFNIQGNEAVTTTEDCAVDLFGPGNASRPSLEEYLRFTPYTRLTWWPQQEVGRVATWQAARDAVPFPGGAPNPYQELGSYFDEAGLERAFEEGAVMWGSLFVALATRWTALQEAFATYEQEIGSAAADLIRQLLASLQDESPEGLLEILKRFLGNQGSQQVLVSLYFTLLGFRSAGGLCQQIFTETFESEEKFENTWSPLIMNDLFLTLDKDKVGPETGQPQRFWDYAWTGLPMDNQISDDLMPTVFTELWIPIEHAQAVMTELRDYFAGGGYERSGTYACEVYGAGASNFWLSPSFGTEVVRIDLYYFGRSATTPDVSFYPQFWAEDVLGQFEYRPHWGKYLPPGNDPGFGAAYLRSRYPRWDDFMAVRQTWDPKQIFVTDYWRSHLGITPPS